MDILMRTIVRKQFTLIALAGCLLCAPKLASAANYALVFSGGVDPSNNHDRYYDETLRMWNNLTKLWGYNVNNVYVLFADGTNPAIDRSSDVSSDWSSIVSAGGHISAATTNDFKNTLQAIGDRMVAGSDDFLFWSFDHGSQTTPPVRGSGSLCAWNDESIYSSEFPTYLNPISSKTPAWDAYVLTQCYAADMISGLNITSSSTNRFAAWAADWNEVSWGKGYADAWASGMESGLAMSQTLGTYAVNNDPFGPKGTAEEHPGWIGGNFSLAVVPEPGSATLCLAGASAAVVFRRRREHSHFPARKLL